MASVASATRQWFQANVASVLPDDTFIWFGSKLPTYSAPVTLEIIGWKGTQIPAELSPQARREETFEINCALTCFAGDNDFSQREIDCVAQWTAISAFVGVNYTLGSNVRWAQMVSYEFSAAGDVEGRSIGTLDFNIECQQRIASLT